jgi:uncharacterized membrane protein HdeD (DUF308 family)
LRATGRRNSCGRNAQLTERERTTRADWIADGLVEAIRAGVAGDVGGRSLDLYAGVLRILAGVMVLVYGSVALLVLVWLLGLQLLACGAIAVWTGLAARRGASHP